MRIRVLGFRVQVLMVSWFYGLEFRGVEGLGFQAWALKFRVLGFAFQG